jgi:hypothetical protein
MRQALQNDATEARRLRCNCPFSGGHGECSPADDEEALGTGGVAPTGEVVAHCERLAETVAASCAEDRTSDLKEHLTMNNEKQSTDREGRSDEPEERKTNDTGTEAEFDLTIRKLELPVRPRGVLAE